MDHAAWPLHAQQGWIVTLTGSILVATVSGETIVTKGQSKGIEKLLSRLCQKKGENSFVQERLYVCERGCAVFVPLGTVAFLFGLDDNRCSKQTPVEASQKKKRRKASDVSCATSIWIPCMSMLDAQNVDPAVVSWSFSQLTISRVQLKPKYIEASGFNSWMETLGVVASSQAKEKKPPAVQEKDDSSSDSE